MDQDATWYSVRPRSRRHYVKWGVGDPTERGIAAPTFRPMYTVAKRSSISATGELLLYSLLTSCCPATIWFFSYFLHVRQSIFSNANDTRSRNRRQKPAPENWRRFLAGASVMRSGAEFFWRQILESNRTMFYFAVFATESGNHVIKILSCDWSLFNVIVVFCFIWKFWFHGGIWSIGDNNTAKI